MTRLEVSSTVVYEQLDIFYCIFCDFAEDSDVAHELRGFRWFSRWQVPEALSLLPRGSTTPSGSSSSSFIGVTPCPIYFSSAAQVLSISPVGEVGIVCPTTRVTILQEEAPRPHKEDMLEVDAGFSVLMQAGPNLIGGSTDNLRSLYEIVSLPLRHPDLFDHLRVECPKGVLLYGPPGTGKTMLVTTVAKFCGAKMFTINGPEIFGPFIGDSEAKLRDKFSQATQYAQKNHVPCILFIDEIVSVPFTPFSFFFPLDYFNQRFLVCFRRMPCVLIVGGMGPQLTLIPRGWSLSFSR